MHTIVTQGSLTYEGVKTRAILIYGEVGNPILELEQIRVEIGVPVRSRLLWRVLIDLVGDLAEPCPITASGCASIENLRFELGVLHHDLVTPNARLRCRTHGIEALTPVTKCGKS